MQNRGAGAEDYFDGQGRLTALSANGKCQKAWQYLAERLEPGRRYTERALSALLNQ